MWIGKHQTRITRANGGRINRIGSRVVMSDQDARIEIKIISGQSRDPRVHGDLTGLEGRGRSRKRANEREGGGSVRNRSRPDVYHTGMISIQGHWSLTNTERCLHDKNAERGLSLIHI